MPSFETLSKDVKHKILIIFQSVSVFSLISLGCLFIDLSSCAIEKFRKRVALEAATAKVFKIKEFAELFCFLSISECSGQILRKTVNSTAYPINSFKEEGFSRKTSARKFSLSKDLGQPKSVAPGPGCSLLS